MSRARYSNNLLGALALALTDRIGSELDGALGAGGNAAAALLSVGTRPDQSIDQLARVLARSHSATVRISDRLVHDGLIARDRDERDRRSALLRLTRPGRRVFERLLEIRHEVIGRATGALSTQERDTLDRLMAKMLATLPRDQAEARTICRLCEHGVCRGAACPVGNAVT